MRLNKTKAITRRPLAILDIGSSKICCMIGEADGAGGVRLLGHGIHASEGVRSGEVSDLDSLSSVIGKVFTQPNVMQVFQYHRSPALLQAAPHFPEFAKNLSA